MNLKKVVVRKIVNQPNREKIRIHGFIAWLIDINDTSKYQLLFYAERVENPFHCMCILSFFV